MPSEHAQHWTLDPEVDFLNHGSFGATPRVVLAAQQAWRERMEKEPVRFFSRDLAACFEDARARLARFVGADPEDIASVPNASTGMSTVLGSVQFEPGDEILTTDHAYNAAKNALQFVAERAGARVVMAKVPFPISGPSDVVDAVLAHVGPKTRLALLDHVTSPTALVFPIERLVAELASRGVDTLVDGAHAPGMLPLDVTAVGAAYYTGNLHKWVCGPKGAAFLHVRRDRQKQIRPLVISHGATSTRTDRSRFLVEADWTGTSDPSAFLAVPNALDSLENLLPGGWDALRRRNHDLALAGQGVLCAALGISAPAPAEMLGSMASVPLPIETSPAAIQGIDLYGDPVHDALIERHRIQVMVTPWPQRPDGHPWRRIVRISAAAYNDLAQMERLAAALRDLVA